MSPTGNWLLVSAVATNNAYRIFRVLLKFLVYVRDVSVKAKLMVYEEAALSLKQQRHSTSVDTIQRGQRVCLCVCECESMRVCVHVHLSMSGPWHSFQMLPTIKVDKEAVLTAEHTRPRTHVHTHTRIHAVTHPHTHTHSNRDKQLRVSVCVCVCVCVRVCVCA